MLPRACNHPAPCSYGLYSKFQGSLTCIVRPQNKQTTHSRNLKSVETSVLSYRSQVKHCPRSFSNKSEQSQMTNTRESKTAPVWGRSSLPYPGHSCLQYFALPKMLRTDTFYLRNQHWAGEKAQWVRVRVQGHGTLMKSLACIWTVVCGNSCC